MFLARTTCSNGFGVSYGRCDWTSLFGLCAKSGTQIAHTLLQLSVISSTPSIQGNFFSLSRLTTKRGKMTRFYTHNINSYNMSNEYTFADKRLEMLTWLSPLEPRIRHQDVRTRRADNVQEWLLQTEEFRKWRYSAQPERPNHATLFCCGDPSVGKTYFR